MKFVIQLVLIVLLAWILQSFFPWWSAVIASFVVGAIITNKSGLQAFAAGLIGVFLLWVVYALLIDINSGSILTEKIARILTIKNKYLLITISGPLEGYQADLVP